MWVVLWWFERKGGVRLVPSTGGGTSLKPGGHVFGGRGGVGRECVCVCRSSRGNAGPRGTRGTRGESTTLARDVLIQQEYELQYACEVIACAWLATEHGETLRRGARGPTEKSSCGAGGSFSFFAGRAPAGASPPLPLPPAAGEAEDVGLECFCCLLLPPPPPADLPEEAGLVFAMCCFPKGRACEVGVRHQGQRQRSSN